MANTGTQRWADARAAAAEGMVHAYWAERFPDRTALFTTFGDRTFDELNCDINRLVRALRRRGLTAGDSVALMCTNRPEFLEVLYATTRGGFRLTPINWHLTGEEAAYIVANCEAKALICSAEIADRATEAAAGSAPTLVKFMVGGFVPGFEKYTDVVAAEEGSDITDPLVGTQMLYTSGTTGRPKGVHREGGAPSARYRDAQPGVRLQRGCGAQRRRPPAHRSAVPRRPAGLLGGSLPLTLYGVPIVLMEHWDAGGDAPPHRATTASLHTHMVPTMFHRLLALPDDGAEQVRPVVAALRDPRVRRAVPGRRSSSSMIEWLGPDHLES